MSHIKNIPTILSKIFYIPLIILFILQVSFSAETFKENSEKYFADLETYCDKLAKTQAAKSTSLRQTDRFFVTVLKKNQPFYSLIKTNSKGIVISEVIRGETHERDYRSIADQRWFSTVSSKLEMYHGLLKEDTGRYYLFWAVPVLKGSGHFVGAVAIKIDLWDCFHKISADVKEPFLIRLGVKSLYDHKWEKGTQYAEEILEIPGVKKISVRLVKDASEPPAADSSASVIAKDTMAKELLAASVEKDKKRPARGFSFKNMNAFQKIITILIIIAALVILFFLSKIFTRIKDWHLRKKIEKEDNLFD